MISIKLRKEKVPTFGGVKKLASILLVIFYLASSAGVVMGARYCKDRLSALHFYAIASAHCPNPQMQAGKDKCCTIVNKWVKIGQKHLSSKVQYTFNQQLGFRGFTPLAINSCPVIDNPLYYYINGPPGYSADTALFIKNCVFLI